MSKSKRPTRQVLRKGRAAEPPQGQLPPHRVVAFEIIPEIEFLDAHGNFRDRKKANPGIPVFQAEFTEALVAPLRRMGLTVLMPTFPEKKE